MFESDPISFPVVSIDTPEHFALSSCCPVFSPSEVLYAGVASKYFVRLELSEAYVNGISGSEKGHFDNGGCQLTA